jgi:hypothetical protein
VSEALRKVPMSFRYRGPDDRVVGVYFGQLYSHEPAMFWGHYPCSDAQLARIRVEAMRGFAMHLRAALRESA